MTDKLAKSEPEECVAVVVEPDSMVRDPGLMSKYAEPVRVQELVPYDYIWNESTRNYEAVFVPGGEQELRARENAEANAKLMALREKKLADRKARALQSENERNKMLGKG